MKIIDVRTYRLLLIFPENSQPYRTLKVYEYDILQTSVGILPNI